MKSKENLIIVGRGTSTQMPLCKYIFYRKTLNNRLVLLPWLSMLHVGGSKCFLQQQRCNRRVECVLTLFH